MSSNVQNNVPYLPTTRKFPIEDPIFENEMTKIYTDIATAVNNRIISIFDLSPIITGEQWFTTATQGNSVQKRQTFRRVYAFSDSSLTFAHGISTISLFTRIYGAFTDGAGVYYPLPWTDVVAANNQITVNCTATNVVVTKGAGAPPTIVSGIIVLEWLAN